MSLDELLKLLNGLDDYLGGRVDLVSEVSKDAQQQVYEALVQAVNRFEIKDGRFVINQDYTSRILAVEREIERILGRKYTKTIGEYLDSFKTVESKTIDLHKAYNEIEVMKSLLTPARKTVLEQAEQALISGLNDSYVQPAKFLLLQQVTTGQTIKDSERLLRNWNKGDLATGKLANGRPTPDLGSYATQVSRDAIYTYHGTINDIISTEYDLTDFIYSGARLKDSRPFCVHLMAMKQPISIEVIPDLVKRFPQGLKPNTTKKNFLQVRGGYNCVHTAFPVRKG